jgi:CHRD domain
MARLFSVLTSLVVIVALSVGVAVAAGYGDDKYGSKGDRASKKFPGGKKQRKKWRQFKDLEQTKAANSAYLTGKAEIDDEGENNAGDSDARGSAIFHYVGNNTICYGFTLRGAATPTIVHIHKGKAGQNGDPVIEFANVPKNAAGQPSGDPGASSGCKVLSDPNEIAALKRIKAKPYRYYLNMHTQEFPDGAVRGQLGRVLFDND